MFKGKIRKCLKCGGEGELNKGEHAPTLIGEWWCNCIEISGHETEDTHEHPYQAVNEWNKSNAPAILLPYL